MTVSSLITRKSFAGDSATTIFATSPVVFFDATDLVVTVVDDTTGVETTLVLNTDYSVSGGNGAVGTVDFSSGSSPYGALPSGETLVILRQLPLLQDVDFVQNDPSDASVAEEALDRLAMIAQQLDEANDRAIKLPITSSLTDVQMPDPTGFAGKFLAVNDAEDGFQLVDGVDINVTPVSAFMATVLDDTTAAAALTTLGVSTFAQTMLDDADAAAVRTTIGFVTPEAVGEVVIGETASNSPSVLFPRPGSSIINGKFSLAVGAGALTVALKTLAGADPSAADPVIVRMPQGNPFDGTYVALKVTSALSVVLSSGSTLGHSDGVACPVYVYLLNSTGTSLVLGVSTKFFGGEAVVTSSAEGGAGGADSAGTLYATAAHSNVPAVCVGRWKSTQTTAGTWAATTGEVQMFPFPFKAPTVQVLGSPGTVTYTRPWDVSWVEVEVQGGGGSGGISANTGASQSSAGGGGGGGGYARKVIAASAVNPTETVTVGTAAATSSFGAHCSATGGTAGGAGGINSAGAGGAAGTGSGGDINLEGSDGLSGFISTDPAAQGGGGGASHLGGGGRNTLTITGGDGAGTAGNLYGGGGGGAASADSVGAGASGGAGTQGIVIVTERY